MSEPTILLHIANGVATITLNRPETLNALNEQMLGELEHALDRVEIDRAIRALVLTGAGRAFCAGQDLYDQATDGSTDLGDLVERLYHPLIRRLVRLERPVICAVNGVAAGAGMSLALACDIVLGARSATFVQAFANVGLVPDSGATYHLPRLIGLARAMGMALLDEPVAAEQAEAWGLIWRAVDDARLQDETQLLARRLATRATFALGQSKRALRASFANTLEQQLEIERDAQRQAGRSEDFREGVAAFMEEREPVFKGR